MMKPSDISDEYWAKLSDQHKALYAIVRPQTKATYTVDLRLNGLEHFLSTTASDVVGMGGSFELDPDFQRGHVWTDSQRSLFIESLLRGCAPKNILFNCPGWSKRSDSGDIPEHTFQCVDGLQRLTAVRMFMADDISIFGGIRASDLRGSPFDPGRYTLSASIYEFSARSDLLTFYIDLNRGGTVHADSEIQRVRELLQEAIREAGDCSRSRLNTPRPG